MRMKSRMPLVLTLVLAAIGLGMPAHGSLVGGFRAQQVQASVSSASAFATLSVQVSVSPSPTAYQVATTITVSTAAALSCQLSIRLPDGSVLTPPNNQIGTGATGTGTFSFTPDLNAVGQDTAIVVCSSPLGGPVGNGTAVFTVLAPTILPTATPYPTSLPGVEQVLYNGPSPLLPGSTFSLVGAGFHPGATMVYAPFGSISLTTAVVQGNGQLVFSNIMVPYSQSPGQYTAVLHNENDPLDNVPVTVTVSPLSPTLTLSQIAAPIGSTLTFKASGFGGNEVVDVSLGPVQLLSVKADNSGIFTGTITVPNSVPTGTFSISARGESTGVIGIAPFTVQPAVIASPTVQTGSTTATASATLPPSSPTAIATATVPPAGAVVASFYFAEGSTSNGTQVGLNILNAATTTAHLSLNLVFPDGTVDTSQQTVGARSYTQVNVNALVDAVEVGQSFSIKVSADQQVSIARSIVRPGKDGSLDTGSVGTYHYSDFAEGYTGSGFHETLALFNPVNANANVELRLLPTNGSAPIIRRYIVGPLRRYTIDVNSIAPNRSIATQIVSDVEIAVDRTLTFGSDNGETIVAAAPAPQTTWYFAEGSTSNGFSEFLTILNPNYSATSVVVDLFDAAGHRIGGKTQQVPSRSRATVEVGKLVHASSIAAVVHSTSQILVERSMYLGGLTSAKSVGTGSFGRSSLYSYYEFPSGDTSTGNQEFLLLLNPNDVAISVQTQYIPTTGSPVVSAVTVPPHARVTVNVGRDVPGLNPGPHALIVQSADPTQTFMAEESIYFGDFSSASSILGVGRISPQPASVQLNIVAVSAI